MSLNKTEVLEDLRANWESEIERDGVVFGTVYLPNSKFHGKKGFPQALAALAKDGDYYQRDGKLFGAVRLAD